LRARPTHLHPTAVRAVGVASALLVTAGCTKSPAGEAREEASGAIRLTKGERQMPDALPERTASLPPEGRAILDQIQGYDRWATLPEQSQPRFSEAHGGRWVVAHQNGVVGASIARRILPFPDGAHIVLENRTAAGTAEPPILTTMSKVAGRWYWMELANASVRVDEHGRPIAGFGDGGTAACASCHARARDDFVFSLERLRRPASRPAR